MLKSHSHPCITFNKWQILQYSRHLFEKFHICVGPPNSNLVYLMVKCQWSNLVGNRQQLGKEQHQDWNKIFVWYLSKHYSLLAYSSTLQSACIQFSGLSGEEISGSEKQTEGFSLFQVHPIPVLLPGKSHGQRSLEGCSPWGHWVTSLSLFTFMHWRRKWQPTPVFLPGEYQGRGSLVGCHLWGCTESDTTEAT